MQEVGRTIFRIEFRPRAERLPGLLDFRTDLRLGRDWIHRERVAGRGIDHAERAVLLAMPTRLSAGHRNPLVAPRAGAPNMFCHPVDADPVTRGTANRGNR